MCLLGFRCVRLSGVVLLVAPDGLQWMTKCPLHKVRQEATRKKIVLVLFTRATKHRKGTLSTLHAKQARLRAEKGQAHAHS